jgi:hypothetical protein
MTSGFSLTKSRPHEEAGLLRQQLVYADPMPHVCRCRSSGILPRLARKRQFPSSSRAEW